MKQRGYTLRETKYKFNSVDDYIDFKVSFNCEENYDRFNEILHKFCEELTDLVEKDQKMAKKIRRHCEKE